MVINNYFFNVKNIVKKIIEKIKRSSTKKNYVVNINNNEIEISFSIKIKNFEKKDPNIASSLKIPDTLSPSASSYPIKFLPK